ncbi:unnamed protein product [Caenorhabditis auriculariae]|uniref:Uncharacterized protein n=1 Tax=Caenorhabditis auriculariae TaxID=2777116 RepID=A0A8S1GTL1_9PELO|nr:unnamed protein product [Caenorhabditis auriculariae]
MDEGENGERVKASEKTIRKAASNTSVRGEKAVKEKKEAKKRTPISKSRTSVRKVTEDVVPAQEPVIEIPLEKIASHEDVGNEKVQRERNEKAVEPVVSPGNNEEIFASTEAMKCRTPPEERDVEVGNFDKKLEDLMLGLKAKKSREKIDSKRKDASLHLTASNIEDPKMKKRKKKGSSKRGGHAEEDNVNDVPTFAKKGKAKPKSDPGNAVGVVVGDEEFGAEEKKSGFGKKSKIKNDLGNTTAAVVVEDEVPTEKRSKFEQKTKTGREKTPKKVEKNAKPTFSCEKEDPKKGKKPTQKPSLTHAATVAASPVSKAKGAQKKAQKDAKKMVDDRIPSRNDPLKQEKSIRLKGQEKEKPVSVAVPPNKTGKKKPKLPSTKAKKEGFVASLFNRAKRSFDMTKLRKGDDTFIALDDGKNDICPDYDNEQDAPAESNDTENYENDGKLFVKGRPFWALKDEKPPTIAFYVYSELITEVYLGKWPISPKEPLPLFDVYGDVSAMRQRDENFFYKRNRLISNTVRSLLGMMDAKAVIMQQKTPDATDSMASTARKPMSFIKPQKTIIYDKKQPYGEKKTVPFTPNLKKKKDINGKSAATYI